MYTNFTFISRMHNVLTTDIQIYNLLYARYMCSVKGI